MSLAIVKIVKKQIKKHSASGDVDAPVIKKT